MAPLVPVSELLEVSVAVNVWLPADFSVALNVPVPLVKRGVGRQDRRGVAAGEVDRAGVAGDRVVERVFGRDGEAEGDVREVALAALTTSFATAAALTLTAPLLPVIDPLTVSVAVIVWLPAVFSVAVKVPVPLVKVALAGRTPAASLLVKWTVPA